MIKNRLKKLESKVDSMTIPAGQDIWDTEIARLFTTPMFPGNGQKKKKGNCTYWKKDWEDFFRKTIRTGRMENIPLSYCPYSSTPAILGGGPISDNPEIIDDRDCSDCEWNSESNSQLLD